MLIQSDLAIQFHSKNLQVSTLRELNINLAINYNNLFGDIKQKLFINYWWTPLIFEAIFLKKWFFDFSTWKRYGYAKFWHRKVYLQCHLKANFIYFDLVHSSNFSSDQQSGPFWINGSNRKSIELRIPD